MRILVVEDDSEYIDIFKAELQSPDFDLQIATNRTEAMAALEVSYELVVCDLKIPPAIGDLNADTNHGMAVLREVVHSYPGTPIIAFTAFPNQDIFQQLLEEGRYGDYLGIGDQRQLITFFTKDQLSECLDRIREVRDILSILDDIEIATGGQSLQLTSDEDRVVRLAARRMGASVVHVRELDGGRSRSRVLGLGMDSSSGPKPKLVAKVGPVAKIRKEKESVDTYAAGFLPVGSFPATASVIECGAGGTGGLFFQIAGFDNHLLSLVLADDQAAAICVAALSANLQGWRDGVGIEMADVAEVRAAISGTDLVEGQTDLLDRSAEECRIHVKRCVQHNDLHVFNVLISDERKGIVIDFAKAGLTVAAFDAVTLELSLAFHPDARVQTNGWPTVEDLGHWSDIDEYLKRCPYPDFVRACRAWAYEAAAGDLEVFASVYAYVVNQLRFDECPKDLAEALLVHVCKKLKGN